MASIGKLGIEASGFFEESLSLAQILVFLPGEQRSAVENLGVVRAHHVHDTTEQLARADEVSLVQAALEVPDELVEGRLGLFLSSTSHARAPWRWPAA